MGLEQSKIFNNQKVFLTISQQIRCRQSEIHDKVYNIDEK